MATAGGALAFEKYDMLCLWAVGCGDDLYGYGWLDKVGLQPYEADACRNLPRG